MLIMSCLLKISEGYGSTETTAAITCTLPREYRSGNLGPPLPVAHVKLADVPEMSLVGVRDNKGEVSAITALCCKMGI
ncbi:unnamed protein product [Protopolystoma xenopodis]|uniref:long-chain-fatty-acid--CoA ligase n=1 Tax=Protopolystoma xenopodis TaxID=117903 RepID=A0A3S5ADL5_9PLAT|nr:unnamed protein product [Protopolystoma xenopodis]